jgi:hypothetical protein
MGANPFLSGFFKPCKQLMENPLQQRKWRTVKNDPKTTLFGRKTGFPRQENDIVQSCFSSFAWWRVTQAIVSQELARNASVAKKSCLKTYRRFFVFGESWYHFAMNDANTSLNGNNNVDSCAETPSCGPGQAGGRRRSFRREGWAAIPRANAC